LRFKRSEVKIMTGENDKRPICLSEFLTKSNEFRVHTGNINQWGELKLRTFINPSEELVECLRLQLENWTPDESMLKCGSGNDFCLCTSPWCQPMHGLAQYSRDELKITVKIFLSKADAEAVKKCVLEIKKELQVQFVDQLIVALPPLDPDLPIQPSISQQLLSMWSSMEQLVSEGHCAALGTADLDADDLKRVWEGAKVVKPLVNHYNIAACCAVPPELNEFAKQHDIILLTHNDPHPFLTHQQVQEIFVDKLKVPEECAKHWHALWAGRVTGYVKARSVIASKGYLVHFQKKP